MDSTRLDLDRSLSLDLHLNSHGSLNQTPKEEFRTQILNPREPSVNEEELSLLAEKLKRGKEENKKLKELLVLTCEKYNSLQSQMLGHLLSNKDEQGLADVPFAAPKKQKSESFHDNNNDVNQGKSQDSSSDDGSCNNRIKEDIKISRINGSTNASETSIVQKSAEGLSILAATCEGKHNHPNHFRAETTMGCDAGPDLVAKKHPKQFRRSARIQAQQQATQASHDPARL